MPHVVALDAGTTVWRVHRRYPPCAVNPTPRPAIPGGGRFDSLTGDYAYTYVGDSPAGIALADMILARYNAALATGG